MESAVELQVSWARSRSQSGTQFFVAAMLACALASAFLAGWLPLQVSIVTVFLFAGPHNWFELRYFLMRLPARLGKSRNFFMTAFAGLAVLTSTYVSLPLLYTIGFWSDNAWSIVIASWNSLLLVWVGLLIWLRGKQKKRGDWTWVFPILPALAAMNWLAPHFFSLAVVYIHPCVALWFLDRHLCRTRRAWLGAYRRCLLLLPVLLGMMIWQLAQTQSLQDDNGLFWRITQHSGAELLPQVSSHLLVSVHLFLEMLHYGVWLLALPLLGPLAFISGHKRKGKLLNPHARIWDLRTVPLARHPHGLPKVIGGVLILGLFLVAVLWIGFSVDYAVTRDVYFTLAIAHVLAEAPFLLRML